MLLRTLLHPPSSPVPAVVAESVGSTLRCGEWYKAVMGVEDMKTKAGFEAAVVAGYRADRLSYAFTAGYQQALCVMGLCKPTELGALCVTESGGNHPSAIKTLADLPPHTQTLSVTGHKTFASLSDEADVFVIVGRQAQDADADRARFLAFRVSSDQEGVEHIPADPLPFLPEMRHGAIKLTNAAVPFWEVIEGDGFHGVAKPFRTVEDIMIQGCLLGQAGRLIHDHNLPQPLLERVVSQCLAGLVVAEQAVTVSAASRVNPTSPGLEAKMAEVHVALAGLLRQSRAVFQELTGLLEPLDSETAQWWVRDFPPLSKIASSARGKRRTRAWETLGWDAEDAERETM